MTQTFAGRETDGAGSVFAFTEDLRLYAHDAGSGPAVVLLHGVGCCADDWIEPARHFQNRFRIVRPDARGHGRSSVPQGPWSLGDFTKDLARILDRLGIQKAHVAGFSMGALIAQAFSLEYPDRVEKLALLCATTGRNKDEQDQIEARLAFIRAHPPASYFREHASNRWFTAEFRAERPDVLEYCRLRVSSNDHEGYVRAYEVLVGNDLGSKIHQIRHKTLVLTAENDIGAGPKAARFIASEIPDSHLIILPRLRHQVLLEAPDIVGGLLREFFSA